MSIFTLFFASVVSFGLSEARAMDLSSLGGSGVKEYLGINKKAWVYRTCKVIIMGTENTPVVYLSVSDSHNSYSFWTYSESFASGSGGNETSVAISDSMNLVYDGSFPEHRKQYNNVVKTSGTQDISEMILEADSGRRLKSVYFRHMSSSMGKTLNEVLCADLRQMPIR